MELLIYDVRERVRKNMKQIDDVRVFLKKVRISISHRYTCSVTNMHI